MKITDHKNQYPLTVITICYNTVDSIAKTFESVRQQKTKSFEYLVIDGDSNDGTKELIETNQDIINYYSSEPDDGIADALNKGISKANGQYIVFLHGGDYFVDDTAISRALSALRVDTDIIAFDIYFESDLVRKRGASRGFNYYTNFKMPFYHPGVLCKKSLFQRIGCFNKNYKIAMDYDFLLKAYKQNASSSINNLVLTVFMKDGISSRVDWKSIKDRLDEEKTAHYKNDPSLFLKLLYFLWWHSYPIYRRIKHIVLNK